MSIVSEFNKGVDWVLSNEKQISDTTNEGILLLQELGIVSSDEVNSAKEDTGQVVDRLASHFAPEYIKSKIKEYWIWILIGGIAVVSYKGFK